MDEAQLTVDDLGPGKVVQVNLPAIGLKAAVVIDNVARGPAVGGLRMAPDVSLAECARLARAMTLKNSAADLPHGGGKSVIWGDPRMPKAGKERLIRAFAHALRNESDYIFGPDMGTDEVCMAWIKDETGRSAGLPAAAGGIPLDEIGATGWGLAQCAEVAVRHCGLDLKGAARCDTGFRRGGQARCALPGRPGRGAGGGLRYGGHAARCGRHRCEGADGAEGRRADGARRIARREARA